ncbi:hypothetical protein NX059_008608 [Plenodomus lindquistii]|nr:hypothetical protein NX059_008608 [Plenodomus lindquistii]
MSLAAIARLDADYSPPLDNWVHESDDIVSRLHHFDHGRVDSDALQGLAHTALSSSSLAHTVRSGSSMAPALVHHYDPATTPPSLYSCPETDATPTDTSISTGLASHFSGVPLLEDRNGILQVPPAHPRLPIYECAFWFLNCPAIFSDKDDWETHCLAHFRGEEPPRSVQCPLCDWSASCDDGSTAWNHRMQHLAYAHTMLGQTLRTSRPDFHLFQHLWQKRLIDDHDLKELKGGNHNLTRAQGNYVETNARAGRRRAERRPQRSQHVAASRQGAPRRD